MRVRGVKLGMRVLRYVNKRFCLRLPCKLRRRGGSKEWIILEGVKLKGRKRSKTRNVNDGVWAKGRKSRMN